MLHVRLKSINIFLLYKETIRTVAFGLQINILFIAVLIIIVIQ